MNICSKFHDSFSDSYLHTDLDICAIAFETILLSKFHIYSCFEVRLHVYQCFTIHIIEFKSGLKY